jgi:formyltetrahydrofolate deformylase
MQEDCARLLIDCADGPGLVAAVSGFLAARSANIIESDQHSTDPREGGHFFMRMVFDLADLSAQLPALRGDFDREVAAGFAMNWRIDPAAERKRVALLASRESHCLMELLWRWERGELPCDIACVISNHDDHRVAVERLGLAYHHVPATPANRPEAEERLLSLLSESACDLVVLARYMQILSGAFLERLAVPVINIHHSFLPAFSGAEPYRRAFERGVKIVGATAHYVIEELDAGPIIEQDVVRVSHRVGERELAALGADVERLVIGRAVRWHLEDRVIVHAGKTVVF